jgi:hypothetical protein
MIVYPRAALRTILATYTAVGGYLAGAKMHLFQNNLVPNPLNVLADFTEATFTGYVVPAAITWNTPYTDSAGSAEVIGTVQQFEATGSAITNIVYGYFVTDGAGAVLLYAESFSTPVSVAQAGDAVIVLPKVPLEQPS